MKQHALQQVHCTPTRTVQSINARSDIALESEIGALESHEKIVGFVDRIYKRDRWGGVLDKRLESWMEPRNLLVFLRVGDVGWCGVVF